VGNPGQTYAILLNLARRHRRGDKPLAEASPAVRKEVISGMPEDPTARPVPTKKNDDPASS
jgi:hypothetical protein